MKLPYEENDGKTHWQGCWSEKGHHNCAVVYIAELRAAASRLLQDLENPDPVGGNVQPACDHLKKILERS